MSAAEAMHRELSEHGVVSEGTAWRMFDEIVRLRAELAIKDEVALGVMAALVQRNDAIVRVRELCAGGFTSCVRCDGVLLALDGGTE